MARRPSKFKLSPSQASRISKKIEEELIKPIISHLGGAGPDAPNNKLDTNRIRKQIQKLGVNFLILEDELAARFNESILEYKEELTELEKLGINITRGKNQELREFNIKLQKAFPSIRIKGDKITASQLKTLIQIAEGKIPARWDQITAIRNLMGIGQDEVDIGHSNASLLALRLEAILKSKVIVDEDQLMKLRSMRKVLKLIDNIGDDYDRFLQSPITGGGRPATSQEFFDAMDSLLSENAGTSIGLNVAPKVFASLARGTLNYTLEVTMENLTQNRWKGGLSQTLSRIIDKILTSSKFTTEEARLLEKVDVANITSSKSAIQHLDGMLTNAILGKKYETNKRSKVRKKEVITPLKFRGKKPRKLKKLPNKAKAIDVKNKIVNGLNNYSTTTIDPLRLHNLINTMLAEEVEKKMATSSQNDGRLRYQTGRFADSANLLTLTSTQAGILAGTYTYQRNPYDAFLPGHRFGTAKRDPRIYVEGAIREAALIILKKQFPGIVLELK